MVAHRVGRGSAIRKLARAAPLLIVPVAAAVNGAGSAVKAKGTAKMNELTAIHAARLIAQRQLTSERLTRACLERIEEREPAVEAWEYLDPDLALAQARLADLSPIRGPLHGVPLAIKDVIDTVDMPTAYGSRVYSRYRPASDATCVALARASGAIILGKTVATEFAGVAPGKTRNPHNPLCTPGGSSSGSAAAVGCAMVPLALGTQTYGSTIRPASFCGVVGYKPNYGKAEVTGIRHWLAAWTPSVFLPGTCRTLRCWLGSSQAVA